MKAQKIVSRSAALRLLIIIVWGAACFAYFQWALPNRFFYQEQNQLFLLTTDYALSYLDKPAWLACLAGDFLTQFYYYLYAGAAILTLALLVLGDLSRRVFQQLLWRQGERHPERAAWIAFALAMLLMTVEAVRCLGHEYRLASTLALAGGMGMVWLRKWADHRFSGLKGNGIRGLLITIADDTLDVVLAYWLFGYGALVVLAFILIDSVAGIVRRAGEGCKSIARGTASLLMVLLLCAAAFCISRQFYLLTPATLLSYPGLGHLRMPRMDVEQALAAENAYYFGQDKKVIAMAQTTPREERTTQLTYYYDLASARQGLLADNLLQVLPTELGTFQRIGPGTPLLTLHSIHDLYYLWGDMTFAERAATLGMVSSATNRNVRMVRRLAEVSIVRDDWPAAMKYLRILSHTLVYREWAERLMGRDAQLMKPLVEKRAYQNTQQTIRGNDNAHRILEGLLVSNPDNKVALHYMLCADLLLKDVNTFKADYDRWCIAMGRPLREALYQQALMIWLAANHAPQTEWQRYITRADLLPSWQQYNEQRGSSAYADTYWFYFDKGSAPEMK